jgi:hypothetical protein
VTAIVTVVGLGASIYFRRKTALVSQAASLPEVAKVVATAELAARVGEPNVMTK